MLDREPLRSASVHFIVVWSLTIIPSIYLATLLRLSLSLSFCLFFLSSFNFLSVSLLTYIREEHCLQRVRVSLMQRRTSNLQHPGLANINVARS